MSAAKEPSPKRMARARIGRDPSSALAVMTALIGTALLGSALVAGPTGTAATPSSAGLARQIVDPQFNVMVEGDAQLYENETEGPVALGGDLSFRTYNVAANDPGTYVAPGDARPAGLVVGGGIDFDDTPMYGQLRVLQNSYAKIGDLSGAEVVDAGNLSFIQEAGTVMGSLPSVSVQTDQPVESVGSPAGSISRDCSRGIAVSRAVWPAVRRRWNCSTRMARDRGTALIPTPRSSWSTARTS